MTETFTSLGGDYTKAIKSLLKDGEELRTWCNGFYISWNAFPYGNGIDQNPSIQHMFVAVTTEFVRTGQFSQVAFASAKERVRKFFSSPVGTNPPSLLLPEISNQQFHPIAHVNGVAHNFQNLPLPFWRDEYGNNWNWCNALVQFTDEQLPPAVRPLKGKTTKRGQLPISTLSFSVSDRSLLIYSFHPLRIVADALGKTIPPNRKTEKSASAEPMSHELNRLHELLTKGAITQSEYDEAKQKLFRNS